jgi:hypothetical protein
VVVEGLENAHRHVSPELNDSVYAVLTCTEECYQLTVGNIMPLVTATVLGHRIAILNEMDESDIKEHYLRLLSHDARTAKGGAGLGLLTMARKTMKPMICNIERLDAAFVGVSLRLSVARGQ